MTNAALPTGIRPLPILQTMEDGPQRLIHLGALVSYLLTRIDEHEFPNRDIPLFLAEKIRQHERFLEDVRAVRYACQIRNRLYPGAPEGPFPTSEEIREACAAMMTAVNDLIADVSPDVAHAVRSSNEITPGKGQIVSVANQKGGVGKTTTSINLAAGLALLGKRVLLIDLDPQGNATSGLGVDKNALDGTVYDCMVEGTPVSEVTLPTLLENLYLAPSNRDLVGAEVELVEVEGREFRLAKAVGDFNREFDYVFIDSPPSLSLLTINGLTTAHGVVITLQCEFYALEGLSELIQTIRLVRDKINPRLRLQGVLLTMYQHTRLSQQVIDDVRGHLGDKAYETVIPRNVTLGEAPSFGKPAVCYDAKSAGAQAYFALAQEFAAHG